MTVNNAESAIELVNEWISVREAERRRYSLPVRPLPDLADRFTRWAVDQDACAATCKLYGNTSGAEGHKAAATVLRAAARDAAREV